MDRPTEGWSAVAGSRGGVWAAVPLTRAQQRWIAALILIATAGFAAAPAVTAEILIAVLIVLASGHMIFRTVIWLAGLPGAADPACTRADDQLPVYSIIVPLYREANMAAGLASALDALDYPSGKLDILVALESDDADTKAAFERLPLGSCWRLIVAPPGIPRTKPRACNVALEAARGDFIVIYDAEDRPERDQLRRAVAAFDAGGKGLACIQARLFPYNARENVITRLFALDFALWFDAMLTGLRRLGFPVPLGGTSNHFRTATLREAGGWDQWNVTEDADLGIRLGRLGHEVGTFNSTTWEEAPVTLKAWLPQRTRWTRGYQQTFFVHSRRSRTLQLPALGLRGWIFLVFFVGASFVFAMVNPVFWSLAAWQFFTGDAPLDAVFGPLIGRMAAGLMFVGNMLCVLMSVLAPIRRRAWPLMPWGFLAPVYWAMISTAAWRAVWVFIRDPFYWEKTPHGLSRERTP
ncbi:MAG: glycosyltransferase [Micropepsaceae bacterium]